MVKTVTAIVNKGILNRVKAIVNTVIVCCSVKQQLTVLVSLNLTATPAHHHILGFILLLCLYHACSYRNADLSVSTYVNTVNLKK